MPKCLHRTVDIAEYSRVWQGLKLLQIMRLQSKCNCQFAFSFNFNFSPWQDLTWKLQGCVLFCHKLGLNDNIAINITTLQQYICSVGCWPNPSPPSIVTVWLLLVSVTPVKPSQPLHTQVRSVVGQMSGDSAILSMLKWNQVAPAGSLACGLQIFPVEILILLL